MDFINNSNVGLFLYCFRDSSTFCLKISACLMPHSRGLPCDITVVYTLLKCIFNGLPTHHWPRLYATVLHPSVVCQSVRNLLEQQLLLTAYRKSYMRKRLVPKWMTLTFVQRSFWVILTIVVSISLKLLELETWNLIYDVERPLKKVKIIYFGTNRFL